MTQERVNENGFYWSSTPNVSTNANNAATALIFADKNTISDIGRCIGLSIRPVYQSKPMINGHEYVDLGLSVKWATCNIGAKAPHELGNQYAWGETTPKDNYTINNCQTLEVQHRERKSFFGTKTEEVIIDRKDNFIDTAQANWGGTWRMPTHYEIDELANKCKWEKTTLNDTKVFKVTGPNGNSIYLRDPGHCTIGQEGKRGGTSCFWSSSPYENMACYLFFFSNEHHITADNRYEGRAVRPVSE